MAKQRRVNTSIKKQTTTETNVIASKLARNNLVSKEERQEERKMKFH